MSKSRSSLALSFFVFLLLSVSWAAAQSEIIVPQLTAGRDSPQDLEYVVDFRFANFSDRPMSLTVELFTDAGAPLEAFFCGSPIPFTNCQTSHWRVDVSAAGQARLKTVPFTTQRTRGWASIRPWPDGTGGDLGAFGFSVIEVVSNRSTFEVVATSALDTVAAMDAFSTFASASTSSPVLLDVVNPSESEAAEVEVRLLSEAGTFVESLTLSPRAKLAAAIPRDLQFGFPGDVVGLLEVTGSIPLAGSAIQELDNRGLHFVPLPLLSQRAVPLLRAEPNPIQVCAGPHGRTTIFWRLPGYASGSAVQVRVGAPDGRVFAWSGRDGAKETGLWVRDGQVFFLVDAETGVVYDRIEVRHSRDGCPAP